MEYEDDYSLAVPLIFTVLAVIVAAVLIKLRSGGEKQQAEAPQEEEKSKVTEHIEEEEIQKEEKGDDREGGVRPQTEGVPVEEVGASEELPQESIKDNETEDEQCIVQERRASNHSSQEEEDSKDEDFEVESDKILKISEADDADDEDFSFKYCPGKLRGSEYEKMLTKDELEEEQRVQREQLGAIFQMMEQNQETFGKMSDHDVKDQLKLYNM
ncbi:matrix-remodeling-associated protein 7 [Spea bombifrons]|uniref:matrix-remodeling-associated protein 7 n=1 Tax=Spea bombifrons TaxID=233779 RepID=UPI00234B68D2|nr:matrix-remodeling-associated protein 7 [Spea bombifrons]